MSKNNITVKYIINELKKLKKKIQSPAKMEGILYGEKFFILFIEFMHDNNISPAGCNFYANVFKEYILSSEIVLQELINLTEIYLEIIKPGPSVYEKRGIISL